MGLAARGAVGGRDDLAAGTCDVGRKLAGREDADDGRPSREVVGTVLVEGPEREVADPVLAWLGRGTAKVVLVPNVLCLAGEVLLLASAPVRVLDDPVRAMGGAPVDDAVVAVIRFDAVRPRSDAPAPASIVAVAAALPDLT